MFIGMLYSSMDRKKRAKLLARLISIPVQLNYLRIEKFEWLLHLIEYVRIYFILTLIFNFEISARFS